MIGLYSVLHSFRLHLALLLQPNNGMNIRDLLFLTYIPFLLHSIFRRLSFLNRRENLNIDVTLHKNGKQRSIIELFTRNKRELMMLSFIWIFSEKKTRKNFHLQETFTSTCWKYDAYTNFYFLEDKFITLGILNIFKRANQWWRARRGCKPFITRDRRGLETLKIDCFIYSITHDWSSRKKLYAVSNKRDSKN